MSLVSPVHWLLRGVASVALVALLAPAASARPANLLAAAHWQLLRPADDDAVLEHAPVAAEGARAIFRISVIRPSEPFWAIELTTNVPSAVPAGTRLRLRFRARSSSRSIVRATVERAGAPYTNVADVAPTLTAAWTDYAASGTTEAYGPSGLAVRFQVGRQAGRIEITGVTLEPMGPDTSLAAADAALRPEAIKARIAAVRMGLLTVHVCDARGRPLSGASVHIEQMRHAFLFGANIFQLNLGPADAFQETYRARFVSLLNYATLPFYWGAFEPEAGRPDYARLEGMARWCAEHGVTCKGHPLVWHEVYPRWAPADAAPAEELLRRRVTEIIPHFRDVINYWDVVNEATTAPRFANGEGAWARRDGPAALVRTALGWARAAGQGSHNTYLYNDYDIGESNQALLVDLAKRHSLPDAIGIQSHMHYGVWPMTKVWQVADRYAGFHKPLHFTEVTVLSGDTPPGFDMQHPPADWPTTPAGEARQADYLEQFYTVLFSHPAVQAITYWDLSDHGAWMNAPAGLLRSDGSPKPAYERLMRLVHGAWWTDARAQTDARGACALRAFYGDYRVTVTAAAGRRQNVQLSFPQGARRKSVTVTLPD